MKPVKHYQWLQIVENCSVVSCIVGSIASVVSQQVVYTSVPLAVALSLNLINKSKFQQQMRQYNATTVSETHQAIQSLQHQVQIPTQTVDLDPIHKSLVQLQQTTQTLNEQFNTRPETQAIEQLKIEITQISHHLNTLSLRFDKFPTYTKVDTSDLENTVANLSHQLDSLITQVNTKPGIQAIQELKVALNKINNDTESQIHQLKEQLQIFDRNQMNSNIANLQNQINDMSQQYSKAPSFDHHYLEERLTEIETKILTTHKDNIARLISAIRQLQLDKAVIEAEITKITNQLDTLKLHLNKLPPPELAVDLSQVETSMVKLDNQLNNLVQKFCI